MFFAKLNDFTLESITEQLEGLTPQPLSTFTISQCITLLQEDHRHGFYFLYQDKRLMYIGTCRSRTIVSRLMNHVDPSENAWMNTLVNRVAEANASSYQDAATEVATTFSIAILSTPSFPPLPPTHLPPAIPLPPCSPIRTLCVWRSERGTNILVRRL